MMIEGINRKRDIRLYGYIGKKRMYNLIKTMVFVDIPHRFKCKYFSRSGYEVLIVPVVEWNFLLVINRQSSWLHLVVEEDCIMKVIQQCRFDFDKFIKDDELGRLF